MTWSNLLPLHSSMHAGAAPPHRRHGGWTGLLLLLAALPLAPNSAAETAEVAPAGAAAPRFVSGPSVSREGGRFVIGFELSQETDVRVRILDAEGRVVRHLGCGVLGGNAPPPFEKGPLKQRLVWDGMDDDGSPVIAATVRVEAGLRPTFGELIGYEPGNLGPRVTSLEVDAEGKLLVAVKPGGQRQCRRRHGLRPGGALRQDPRPLQPEPSRRTGMAQTDRGEARGDGPEDAVLHLARHLLSPRGSQTSVRATPDGTFRVAWSDSGAATELDRHGLLTGRRSHGKNIFAIGPSGAIYQVEGHTYHDPEQLTISKRDSSGSLLSDFVHAGRMKLAEPRFFLGKRSDDGQADLTPGLAGHQRSAQRKEAKVAGDDEESFRKIVDIACDADENIYVVDAGKGVVKVYRQDGLYLGEVSSYMREGVETPLDGLSAIAVSHRDGALYVIVPGEARGSSRIVKLRGFDDPATAWIMDTPRTADAIAVDAGVEPPIVWIGTTDLAGAVVVRVPDLGDRLGEPRAVGASGAHSLRRPVALAAAADGTLFIFDAGRSRYMRVARAEDGDWRIEPFLGNLAGPGGLSRTLHVDQARGHVYIAHASPLVLSRWDTDGKPVPFASTGTNSVSLRAKVVRGITTSRDGRIYLSVVTRTNLPETPPRTLFRLAPEKIQEVVDSVPSEGPFPSIRGQAIAWGHVDVLDADGTLVHQTLCSPHAPNGLAVDSRGAVYVMDTIYNLNFNALDSASTALGCFEIGELVKFPPGGGQRSRDEEWVHKGISAVSGLMCGCNTGYMTIDADDRVVVPDTSRFQVKVLDVANNVICHIGTYGNRDCAGPQSAYPEPEIPFRSPAAVAVVGDDLYVTDDLSKRIVRCRLAYALTADAVVP